MNTRSHVRTLVTLAALACAPLITLWPYSARAQGNDIFAPEAVAIETKALSRLKPADRLKVRRALSLLHQAQLTASIAGRDTEQVAAISRRADAAVDAAAEALPVGALRGALVSCKKALGHSFILRLVNNGGLDPAEPSISEAMEDITLRYQLASVATYERPARVLEFAQTHLLIADTISARVGITQKRGRGVK